MAADTPTPVAHRTSPLHWFTGRLHEVLDELGDPQPWVLNAEELVEVVTEQVQALSRLQAQLAATLADANGRDLPTQLGATSLPAWLRTTTRHTPRAARDLVWLAEGLENHDATRAALAAGEVLPEQAVEIIRAVDALPDTVSPEEVGLAEQHLLVEAATHDARGLRALGKHLLDVIDPDTAEERLNAQLEKEEAEAARKTTFTGFHDGHGSYHFKGRMPSLDGAVFESLLGAFLNPARPGALSRQREDGAPIPTPELRGQALVELLHRYPKKKIPHTGGSHLTVVVTMSLETLEGRLQAAGILGTDLSVSAGQARRLACEAGLIPRVLGGASQTLDWGRVRRLHTPAQRLALAVQQGGTCGIEDCERPSTWCDAHHAHTAWADGGRTDLANGVLLCPRHHTLAHAQHLRLHRQTSGGWRLVRRQ